MKVEAPRGTHDILPSEQPLWQHVIEVCERLCGLYGYRPIQTPVFEDTALFVRTSGEGSDVVQKEMYTFTDRGGRSLTLRPEATAPICRAYVEHGLHREPQPQKLYTVASMYRYSAPQKGRYREHWQLSVEAIGSADAGVDAELIQLYDTILRTLGVSAYRLAINSIGDTACRPAYLERLHGWLAEHGGQLDEDTRTKARTSPLRVFDNLDAKPPGVRAALAGAPTIGESLCDACREHFASVRRLLDACGVSYDVEPTLVRGLDYYTRTTWEFVDPAGGAQSTISGGGRYDGLVEEVGGPPTPGVGFGAGIERLVLALEDAGVAAAPPGIDVFFMFGEGADRTAALAQMALLRAAGIACDADYAGRSPKGQRTQLARSGASGWALVIGESARVKPGREADEATVPVDRLAEAFLP
ncbi:MAG: histidine--tRNA ligase [Thermoleophilia bacterium]|nr:histidine--tRNA ligase [Thermoleophilia bacterium]